MMAELHRFAHEAMATTFEILIASDDTVAESAEYARQAAQAAFHEIDRLEKDLSRFIESSDVSRINKLGSRESVRVSIDTFECLQLAARIHDDTGGAFDVTIGALLACWRTSASTPRRPTVEEVAEAKARTGMERVALDRKNFTVRLKTDGVLLDLGGIGKGFALDKAAETLREWADEGWGLEAALLSGGQSSLLAMGAPPGERAQRFGNARAGSAHYRSENRSPRRRSRSRMGVFSVGSRFGCPLDRVHDNESSGS
jgi:thiamine biosynthesis lipoprotein